MHEAPKQSTPVTEKNAVYMYDFGQILQKWLDYGQILVRFLGRIGQIVSQILESFNQILIISTLYFLCSRF